MTSSLYKEELMEHYKHPSNKKQIKNPDFESESNNPSCGDQISITGKLDGEIIADIGFQGSGCVISQATASILMGTVKGKEIEVVLSINKDDVLKLIGLELGPNRLRCAMLSLQVLQDALKNYKGKK